MDPLAVQAAKKQFGNRIAVIKHLSDKRFNAACREHLKTLPQLPDDIVASWDERDRLARKEAVKNGHSHPLVGQYAKKQP